MLKAVGSDLQRKCKSAFKSFIDTLQTSVEVSISKQTWLAFRFHQECQYFLLKEVRDRAQSGATAHALNLLAWVPLSSPLLVPNC